MADGSLHIGRDNVNISENIVISGNLNVEGSLTGLTKSSVGLGNVIDVLQLAATEKGVANGVATLDASGVVPLAQLPANIGGGGGGGGSGGGNISGPIDANLLYGNIDLALTFSPGTVPANALYGNIDLNLLFTPQTVPASALYGTLNTSVLPTGMALDATTSTTVFSISSLDQTGYCNVAVSNATTLDTARIDGGFVFTCAGTEGMALTGSTTLNGFDGLTLPRGSAQKPGGGSWQSYSDRRLKMNITEANVDQCYEIIKKLPLQRFEFVPEYVTTTAVRDTNVVGWIADDVEDVFPKAVTTTTAFGVRDLKSLDVDQLYKTMWGAMTKLIRDKERLEARLEALEHA
jgi:hypothetical protein